MNELQDPPLTDGELADRIVAAIHHGFALAATETEFPDRVEAATVNAILAVVQPELDQLRAERDELREQNTTVVPQAYFDDLLATLDAPGERNEKLARIARLQACDCFPNPNDHAGRCPIYQAAAPAGEEW